MVQIYLHPPAYMIDYFLSELPPQQHFPGNRVLRTSKRAQADAELKFDGLDHYRGNEEKFGRPVDTMSNYLFPAVEACFMLNMPISSTSIAVETEACSVRQPVLLNNGTTNSLQLERINIAAVFSETSVVPEIDERTASTNFFPAMTDSDSAMVRSIVTTLLVSRSVVLAVICPLEYGSLRL